MIRRLLNPAFLAALAIMLIAAVGFTTAVNVLGFNLKKLEIYPEGNRRVDAMPSETKGWIRLGIDRRETAEVETTLGTTNYVSRLMQRKTEDGTGDVIDFHAAYYTGGIDTVPHVPDRCFIGGGMLISDNPVTLPLDVDKSGWVLDETVPEHLKGQIYTIRTSTTYSDLPGRRIRLPKNAHDIKLRVMSFQDPMRPESKLYAGYFFIANGGLVTTAEEVRLLSFDLTTKYAYFLKVQFTSRSAESPEAFAKKAADLLSEYLPEIVRCVPDWVEVELGNYPPDNPLRLEREKAGRA